MLVQNQTHKERYTQPTQKGWLYLHADIISESESDNSKSELNTSGSPKPGGYIVDRHTNNTVSQCTSCQCYLGKKHKIKADSLLQQHWFIL